MDILKNDRIQRQGKIEITHTKPTKRRGTNKNNRAQKGNTFT